MKLEYQENEMQSFHNDESFKAQMLEAAEAHRLADEYISGTYHDEDREVFHGCSVGCSLYDVQKLRGVKVDGYENHSQLAEALGVPEWFTHLQDSLFEGVSAERRPKLTGELLGAIPVGMTADAWEGVEHKLHIFIQTQNLERVKSLGFDDDVKAKVLAAIQGVIDVRQKALDFGWDESAARSAAESAARSAWSARSAAWSAWSAEESAHETIADHLITLLS